MSHIYVYLAKYPFFSEAKQQDALREMDLEETLKNSDDVLRRATERVVKGVNSGRVTPLSSNPGTFSLHEKRDQIDIETELKSYPVARILVSLIGDYRIIDRYARAEAETASVRLKDEVDLSYAEETYDPDSLQGKSNSDITLTEAVQEFGIELEKTELKNEIHRTYIEQFFDSADNDSIRRFAHEVFNVQDVENVLSDETISMNSNSELYQHLHDNKSEKHLKQQKSVEDIDFYRIPFVSYVKTAVGMNETRWRLTNRGVKDGTLIIPSGDVFQLFEEAVFQRVSEDLPYDVSENLATILRNADPFRDESEVPDFWSGQGEDQSEEEYDFIEQIRAAINDDHFSYEIDRVEPGLFPPIIERLLDGVRSGENLQHEARFTLVAFLINIGMSEDEIVDMLDVGGSFAEEPTRYQVGHIKNGGGGGDSYTPANYATMESWGIEWEKDALEQQVMNPLSYYKIKLKDEEDEDGESDDIVKVEPTTGNQDGGPSPEEVKQDRQDVDE